MLTTTLALIDANRKALQNGTLLALAKDGSELCLYVKKIDDVEYRCAIGSALSDDIISYIKRNEIECSEFDNAINLTELSELLESLRDAKMSNDEAFEEEPDFEDPTIAGDLQFIHDRWRCGSLNKDNRLKIMQELQSDISKKWIGSTDMNVPPRQIFENFLDYLEELERKVPA